jgi:hypothetical protein
MKHINNVMTFKEFFNEYVDSTQRNRNQFGMISKKKDAPDYPKADTEWRNYKTFDPKQFKAERESTKTSDWQQQLQHALKYHGVTTNDFEKFPRDGSLLYRGHKHLNAFELGPDAKAEGGTYFTNSLSYAFRVYANSVSRYSDQIGQKSLNTLQHATKTTSTSNTRAFDVPVGYITVATPKNVNDVVWYQNFGYENRNRADMDTRGRPVSKDQLTRIPDAETVVNKNDIVRVRSYVVWKVRDNSYKMVRFDIIRKNYPELYQEMMQAQVS